MFSERLQEVLRLKGITLYRLCKLANISSSTLTDIKTGRVKNPGLDILSKIAHALNMTVSELTGEDMQEKPIDKWTLIIEKAKGHKISPEKLDKLVDFLIEEK